MINYLMLLRAVLVNGDPRMDRTGVGTRALFGQALEFDLADGFPAVTTKRLAFGQVAAELAAFLQGAEYLSEFHRLGCKIWDANATAPYWIDRGQSAAAGVDVWLGRIYGVQWRRWRRADGRELDQLGDVVQRIRSNPTDRRLVVTAWNPGELDQMCLPPCHLYYQFFVERPGRADARLHCLVLMRSVDIFLGMPFDIASYALLLHIVARQVGLRPGVLKMQFVDCHLYNNHVDQAIAQTMREPHAPPQLWLDPACTGVDDFAPQHAELLEYVSAQAIRAEMNV